MSAPRPLYDLLPVVHRMRDAERGTPLQGLLEVVEQELRRLLDDVDALYDNWFIETCADWVVPYLGDLLGVPGSPDGATSQRALVADTLRLRRRKGTPIGLEQVARDVTGWPAHVVEYFQLLATTQHLDHVRPGRGGTVTLRDAAALGRLAGPFSEAARTGEVRHVDIGRGRFNVASIGLHLWRLGAYPIEAGDARAVDRASGRWTFDPGGRDVPLFNRPQSPGDVLGLSTEADVPGPLSSQLLEARLQDGTEPEDVDAEDDGRCPPCGSPVTRPPGGVVRVWWGPQTPSAPVQCGDLSAWTRPTDDAVVLVDPVLGRLTLAEGVAPARVQVDYSYGFPGDVGAGPWDRRDLTAAATAEWPFGAWQVAVSAEASPRSGRVARSLSEAVSLWRTHRSSEGQTGVIAVVDNGTYVERDLQIELSPGERLLIVAATLPSLDDGLSGASDPVDAADPVDAGGFDAVGLRPHLVGTLRVRCRAGAPGPGAQLVLSGLSIEGRIVARPGMLARLAVLGCTLRGGVWDQAAGAGSVVATDNPELTVELERTVATGVRLRRTSGVRVAESVLHARGLVTGSSVDAPDGRADIDGSTLLGRTSARSLTASNAILRGRVDVRRQQSGWIRYSFLPADSRSPRRYRCPTGPEVAPRFASTDPDDPRFVQLHEQCPPEISAGADDQGELGAYHFVQERRRVANLTAQFDHYLPFGLEAGVFFAT